MRKELVESKFKFGEHKEKTLIAMDRAILQIELALKNSPEADRVEPLRWDTRYLYSGYGNFAHLRHSVVVLREAERQLKEARHNYGGHRDAAVRDIHAAVVQLELLLDRAK